MRRLIASVLVLSLLVQSSALANTTSAQQRPSLWQSLMDALHPMTAAISGSDAGARRNPPPGREIVTPAPVPSLHPQIAVRPVLRQGVQLVGPHMLTRPLRLDEHPQDPRALLRKPSAPTSAPNTHVMSAGRFFTAHFATPMPLPSAFPPPIVAPVPSRLPPPVIPSWSAIGAMSDTRGAIRALSVQQFQYEADVNGGPSVLFTIGSGAETGAVSRLAVSAPASTPAPAPQTLTFSPTSASMSFGWVTASNVPNLTSWPAQSYAVTLNVTQPNANVKVTAVTIYRVDSTGGPSSSGLAQVATLSNLSQALSNASTYSWTLSGTAQTANASDRLGVKFTVSYSGTTTTSLAYLAGSGSGSGVNVSGSGSLPTSTTGFNPWWTYYGGALPGQGSYALNVANGNLLAKVVDFDTPERGVDLAFQRVYNSSSTHDANDTDGSIPGSYGDGWTSSFDARIAYHGSNTISVYDIDGTRIDYTANGSGGWTPPAGQYASLEWDGGCGYQWFKPNGTVYYFYSPDLNAGTPSASGVTVVQTKTGAQNSVSSYSVPALSSMPKAGNLLVLAVGYDHSQADVSTSLSGWTFVGKSTNDPTFYNTVYVWEKVVQTGDTGSATITSLSAHNFSSVEYEISGENPSSPYEAFATSTAQNKTSLTVTSGVPAAANDLPIAFFENRNYTTSGLASGWTEDATATSNDTRVEAQHGSIDTLAVPQTAQLSWSTAGYPVAAVILIDPAGQSVSCNVSSPQDSAYGGRLYQILGRNYNNNVTFTYWWAGGDASNPANLTKITATHSDGDAVTLNFGLVNGSLELSSVMRPDGRTLSYAYTGSNLTEVDLPGVNDANPQDQTTKETYQYGASHILTTVMSPLYNQSVGAAGDQTVFQYDSSNRVNQIKDSGFVNVVPNDDTNPHTALQSGSTGLRTWTTTNFTWASGETELSDMYAHYVNWFTDSAGRATEIQRSSYTPSGSVVWLSTAQSWDSSNNLIGVVDPRGMVGSTPDPTYETDYAYDTAGDVVAAAQPSVTVNNGTYRATSVYSYDGKHNLTAVCDPVRAHSLGLDWNGSGQSGNPGTSNTRCPSSAGSVHYTWDASDANEPYGRVSDYYTANGYHLAVAYNAASEANVDAGLPTSVTGDPISQTSDSTTPSRRPTETTTYDARGNVTSTNNGKGSTTYAYDNMDRLITTTDADTVSSYACYNDNGTVFYTETASQHAADGSPAPCSTPLPVAGVNTPVNAVSYTYDADGNESSEVHHYGNITGTTSMWHDAGDRLVEVQLPLDATTFPSTSIPHDLYPNAWMTRYLYDNTGALLWTDGSSNGVYGDGHLFKVQEYLPSNPSISGTAPSAQTWMDVRGWAWDPLDVPVHVYEFALGNSPRISYTYNGSNSTMGMLYQMFYGEGPSTTNPTVTPSYLTNGWVSQVSYANDAGLTPTKNYTYDADGRPTVLNTSTFGNETRSYDNDGNLTGVIEPTTYGGNGNISYVYYGDDSRQSVTVSSSALNNGTNETTTTAYRPDGLPEIVQPSWTGSANFTYTYTSAGRMLTESDPYTGQAIPIYNQSGTNTGTSRTMVDRQFQYDSYGRVCQAILPEGYTYGTTCGQSGSFTYDGEDKPTSYQVSNGLCNSGSNVITCSPATQDITYGVRGEILATTGSPNRQSADGVLCTPYSGGCKESFDARNGMLTSSGGLGYSYDAYGRNTGVTMSGYRITRVYDADSHIVSQQNQTGQYIPCISGVELGCDYDNQTYTNGAVDIGSGVTYTWGASGHPVEIASDLQGGATTTYWEHWDPASNQVLFESGSNLFTNLAIGPGVSRAANGVTVEDRDLFGQVASTHTANQFTVWSQAPPAKPIGRYVSTLTGGTGSNYQGSDTQLASRVLDASRPDAFVDHTYGISFQGVRTADVNSGSWTTPDWFAGYGDDAMSQQPYTWNGNNWLTYSDPSGYCESWQATVTYQDGHTVCIDESFGSGNTVPDITDITVGGGADWFGIPPGLQIGFGPLFSNFGDNNRLFVSGYHSRGKFQVSCKGPDTPGNMYMIYWDTGHGLSGLFAGGAPYKPGALNSWSNPGNLGIVTNNNSGIIPAPSNSKINFWSDFYAYGIMTPFTYLGSCNYSAAAGLMKR